MKTLKCEEVRPLLSDLIARAIEPHESKQVMTHLERCASCQSLADDLVRQDLTIRELVARDTLDILARLHSALDHKRSSGGLPTPSGKPSESDSLPATKETNASPLRWAIAARNREAQGSQTKNPRRLPHRSRASRIAFRLLWPAALAVCALLGFVFLWTNSGTTTPPGGGNAPGPSASENRAAGATLELVEGEVYTTTTASRSPAKGGDNVLSGSGIQTVGKRSRAILKFPDLTLVEVGSNTTVRQLRAGDPRSGSKGSSGKHLSVVQGVVKAEVSTQPQGSPMLFATPHAEAKVLGTSLRIVVGPGDVGSTRLEVEEGNVQLKNLTGETVEVMSGHYAVAATGVLLSSKRTATWNPEATSGWGVNFDPSSGVYTFRARQPTPQLGLLLASGEAWDIQKAALEVAFVGEVKDWETKFHSIVVRFDAPAPPSTQGSSAVMLYVCKKGLLLARRGQGEPVGVAGWTPGFRLREPAAVRVRLDAKNISVSVNDQLAWTGPHDMKDLSRVGVQILAGTQESAKTSFEGSIRKLTVAYGAPHEE